MKKLCYESQTEACHRRWGCWLLILAIMRIQDGIYCTVYRWLMGTPQPSLALTKRKVAGGDLREGSTPCHRSRVQVLTIVYPRSVSVPMFWMSTTRASPSFSWTKNNKGIWELRCQSTDRFIKPFFKALKAMPSCFPHKIGSGLSFFSNTHRDLLLERDFGSSFSNNWKSHNWHLVLGHGKFRPYKGHVDSGIVHVLMWCLKCCGHIVFSPR